MNRRLPLACCLLAPLMLALIAPAPASAAIVLDSGTANAEASATAEDGGVTNTNSDTAPTGGPSAGGIVEAEADTGGLLAGDGNDANGAAFAQATANSFTQIISDTFQSVGNALVDYDLITGDDTLEADAFGDATSSADITFTIDVPTQATVIGSVATSIDADGTAAAVASLINTTTATTIFDLSTTGTTDFVQSVLLQPGEYNFAASASAAVASNPTPGTFIQTRGSWQGLITDPVAIPAQPAALAGLGLFALIGMRRRPIGN